MTHLTRRMLLNGICSHEEYYSQFVSKSTKARVLQTIPLEKLIEVEGNLSKIPLKVWDTIPADIGTTELMEKLGDTLTLSGQVCIAKEAARQILKNLP